MKLKVFFIIFKDLPLKKIKPSFLKGESLVLIHDFQQFYL